MIDSTTPPDASEDALAEKTRLANMPPPPAEPGSTEAQKRELVELLKHIEQAPRAQVPALARDAQGRLERLFAALS